MSRTQKEILESIDKRLKWILTFRAMEFFDEDATVKEQVKQLHKMGFENQDMAEIIGTTAKTVRARKSDLRSEGEIE